MRRPCWNGRTHGCYASFSHALPPPHSPPHDGGRRRQVQSDVQHARRLLHPVSPAPVVVGHDVHDGLGGGHGPPDHVDAHLVDLGKEERGKLCWQITMDMICMELKWIYRLPVPHLLLCALRLVLHLGRVLPQGIDLLALVLHDLPVGGGRRHRSSGCSRLHT